MKPIDKRIRLVKINYTEYISKIEDYESQEQYEKRKKLASNSDELLLNKKK